MGHRKRCTCDLVLCPDPATGPDGLCDHCRNTCAPELRRRAIRGIVWWIVAAVVCVAALVYAAYQAGTVLG
jgi:hypothetical protein